MQENTNEGRAGHNVNPWVLGLLIRRWLQCFSFSSRWYQASSSYSLWTYCRIVWWSRPLGRNLHWEVWYWKTIMVREQVFDSKGPALEHVRNNFAVSVSWVTQDGAGIPRSSSNQRVSSQLILGQNSYINDTAAKRAPRQLAKGLNWPTPRMARQSQHILPETQPSCWFGPGIIRGGCHLMFQTFLLRRPSFFRDATIQTS